MPHEQANGQKKYPKEANARRLQETTRNAAKQRSNEKHQKSKNTKTQPHLTPAHMLAVFKLIF